MSQLLTEINRKRLRETVPYNVLYGRLSVNCIRKFVYETHLGTFRAELWVPQLESSSEFRGDLMFAGLFRTLQIG